MAEPLIALPDREEMLRRLTAVDNLPHLVDGFYPSILKGAGSDRTAIGVVMLVQLAIADYTSGLPPVMGQVLRVNAHRYVEALIDDEAVRGEALKILAEVQVP